MEEERLKAEKEKREERERERQERRVEGQQGIGQCKLLSIVRNGASACLNQSTNFRMRS